MKRNVLRIFALLLGLLLLLPGCAPQAKLGDLVREPYISPELTFGVMDAQKLEQDPNLNRLTVTSGCTFAETDMGFYQIKENTLYYADKADMELWIPTCAKPKCKHTINSNCSAWLTAMRFLVEDDRIHFLDTALKHKELTLTTDNGFAIYSMEQNGNDVTLVRLLDETLYPGGCGQQALLFPDHVIYMGWELTKEGNETRRILRIDSSGTQILYELVDLPGAAGYGVTARSCGIYGEDAFMTSMIEGGFQTLCWAEDGKLVTADLADLPTVGSYFSNNILRCYKQNDGYYDINLLNGETTKLAQPQLKNGYTHIIQPNCILESTLLNVSSTETREGLENHSLRLFDGTVWHDVSLPEELLNAPDSVFVYPMGIGTDVVYLRSAEKGDGPGSPMTLYKIVLGTNTPSLEYCGKIAKFVPEE